VRRPGVSVAIQLARGIGSVVQGGIAGKGGDEDVEGAIMVMIMIMAVIP
jgi:hypothetical protein